MAQDKKISQLTPAGPLSGSELAVIASGADNYSVTVNQLKAVNTDGVTVFGDGTLSSPLSASIATAGWSLTGNAGTIPSTNFLGTTDNTILNIRVNNIQSGVIDHLLHNTALGYQSLQVNTSGNNNSAFGYQSLRVNTSGNNNSAFGYQSLFSNFGVDNTAVGHTTLYSNTNGIRNNAFGMEALYSNDSGSANSAFGWRSLKNNTTGYSNSAFGYITLMSNTTGYENSAFGLFSLTDNTTGINNDAFGKDSLTNNTTGNSNSAFGDRALYLNVTGDKGVAVGYHALYSNTQGNNTAVGAEALKNASSGCYDNTAIGYQAGSGIYSGQFNSTSLGARSLATENNQIKFGNSIVHWTFDGMAAYANNAAALLGGLIVGDIYYTNVGGDGILKIVI